MRDACRHIIPIYRYQDIHACVVSAAGSDLVFRACRHQYPSGQLEER